MLKFKKTLKKIRKKCLDERLPNSHPLIEILATPMLSCDPKRAHLLVGSDEGENYFFASIQHPRRMVAGWFHSPPREKKLTRIPHTHTRRKPDRAPWVSSSSASSVRPRNHKYRALAGRCIHPYATLRLASMRCVVCCWLCANGQARVLGRG